MGFTYDWDDDAQTILRYTAEPEWNWNDYHKTVRAASFSLYNLDHTVDVVIDLRQTRRLPAGAVAHVRTFGKRLHPNLSGRVVVIGLDEAIIGQIAQDGVLQVGEQAVYFVNTEDEADTIIKTW